MIPTHALTLLFHHFFKIIFAVIVAEFFTRFDGLPRNNEHALTFQDGFAVGFARVVDVAREVFACGAVDRVVRVGEIEEIVAAFFLRLFVGNDLAPVLNHKLSALNG